MCVKPKSAFLCPQWLQVLLLAKNWGAWVIGMPRLSALYLSFVRKPPSAESDNAFASFLFLSMLVILSVSIPIAAALRTIRMVAWW